MLGIVEWKRIIKDSSLQMRLDINLQQQTKFNIFGISMISLINTLVLSE